MSMSLRDALTTSKTGLAAGLRTIATDLEFGSPISARELIVFGHHNSSGIRPFYVIAHRCNDLEKVRTMVGLGTNAIECDIRPMEGPAEFVVNHDTDLFGNRDALVPFLDGLVDLVRKNPHLALIIFDCKRADAMNSERLRELVRKRLTDIIPVHVLFSIANFADRSFFQNLIADAREGEGFAIDQDDDPGRVDQFFSDVGITRNAFGDGIAVPVPKPSLHGILLRAVAMKWSRRTFRMVYVWTLDDRDAMRDYVRMGVDGIFVNDVGELISVVQEPAFADSIRLALRSDDPFSFPPRRAYVIRTVTGVQHGAGTDAHVRFEIVGTQGELTRTLNARPAGLFEAGQTQDLAIIGRHVGRLRRIVVAIDTSGAGPDWFLSSLSIRATGSPTEHTFDVQRWITPQAPLRLDID
jgi:hypothetical protein